MKVCVDPFYRVADEVKRFVDTYHKREYSPDPIDVDWDYLKQTGNRVIFFTAINDNDIIGLGGFQLDENPLNKKDIFADNLIFSVRKEFRKEAVPLLLETSHAFFRKVGVHRVNYILDDNIHKALQRFMSMKGYKKTKTMWSMEF